MREYIFNLLLGRWRINRSISPQGLFSGECHIEKISPDLAEYKESGTFNWKNSELLRATQNYFILNTPHHLAMHFSEGKDVGKLFHIIHLSRVQNTISGFGRHLCIHDTYEARYEFLNNNLFHMNYHVQGPAKNYAIHSTFSRL